MQTLYKTLEDGTKIFVDDEGFYIEALEQKFYGTIDQLKMRSNTIECIVLEADGTTEKRIGFIFNGMFYSDGERFRLSDCLRLNILDSKEYTELQKVVVEIDKVTTTIKSLERQLNQLLMERAQLSYKFTLWQQ